MRRHADLEEKRDRRMLPTTQTDERDESHVNQKVGQTTFLLTAQPQLEKTGRGGARRKSVGGTARSATPEGREDRGMPILFLLGVPGQRPRTPDFKQGRCRA